MPNSLRSYAMREPVRASYRLREFASLIRFGGKRCRPSGPTGRLKGVHCAPVRRTAAAAAGLPRSARGSAYRPVASCSGRPLRLHGSAALSATAGGPWPPSGPAALLVASLSRSGLGSVVVACSAPMRPSGPLPLRAAPLVGPRLCRRLPLLGLVGLPWGRRRVRPPWGRWAVRASPSLGFLPPPPPRSAQCVLSGCGVAYPCRSVKDKRAARPGGPSLTLRPGYAVG